MTSAEVVLYSGAVVLALQVCGLWQFGRLTRHIRPDRHTSYILAALVITTLRQMGILVVALVSRVGIQAEWGLPVLVGSLTLLPLLESALLLLVVRQMVRVLRRKGTKE